MALRARQRRPAWARCAFNDAVSGAHPRARLGPDAIAVVARRAQWVGAFDYAPTQSLAAQARAAEVPVIVYESVRDPQRGTCVAALDPAALVNSDPLTRAQSWFLTVRESSVIWQREGSSLFEFDFAAFAQ